MSKTTRAVSLAVVISQLALILFIILTTILNGAIDWRFIIVLVVVSFIYWAVLKLVTNQSDSAATGNDLKLPFLLMTTFVTICVIWYDYLVPGTDRWEVYMGLLTLPFIVTLLMTMHLWHKKLFRNTSS